MYPHSPSSGLKTYECLRSAPDDVRRELNQGNVFELPSPSLLHQSVVGNLAMELFQWAKEHGGKAYLSPLYLYISPQDVFIPDLTFYTEEQMATSDVQRAPDRLTVPPFLIAEVVSDLTRRNARIHKTLAYVNFGILHYWVIDPALQTLEALELRDSRYSIVRTHEQRETFSPDAFPTLQITLEKLFEW